MLQWDSPDGAEHGLSHHQMVDVSTYTFVRRNGLVLSPAPLSHRTYNNAPAAAMAATSGALIAVGAAPVCTGTLTVAELA